MACVENTSHAQLKGTLLDSPRQGTMEPVCFHLRYPKVGYPGFTVYCPATSSSSSTRIQAKHYGRYLKEVSFQKGENSFMVNPHWKQHTYLNLASSTYVSLHL